MLRRIMNRLTEKKRFFFVFFLSLFLILGSFSFAQAAPNEGKPVRIGYIGYSRVIDPDGSGGYFGYSYEYMANIGRYTHWNYEYVYGTLEECLDRLANGEIDLMVNIRKTPANEEDYALSRNKTGLESALLCVKQDREDLYYEDFENFDGMRVGVIKGTQLENPLREYATRHNFRLNIVLYASHEAQLRALQAGEIDAALKSSIAAISQERIVASFAPEPVYFMARKGNDELLDELDQACDRILLQDSRYFENLYDKYYGNTKIFEPPFTRREAEIIKSQPELTVVYNPRSQPVEYYDEEEGKAKGIAVDLLQNIADTCGLKLKFIKTKNYQESLKLLETFKADILCTYDEDMEAGSDAEMALSRTYLEVPFSFLTMKGSTVDSWSAAGIVEDRFGLQRKLKKYYPHMKTVLYPSIAEAAAALENGEISYLVESNYVIDEYLKRSGNKNMQVLPYGYEGQHLCLGLSYNRSPELLEILNKVILRIREEDRNKIILSNVSQAYSKSSINIFAKKYFYKILIFVIMLILLFLLYVLYAEKRKKEELARLAFYDELTGTGNLEKFKIDAQELLGQDSYVLVKFDINRFKAVTTGFGTKEGERLLKMVSNNLRKFVGDKELFARASNDLFVILLKDAPDNQLRERLLYFQANINQDIAFGMTQYTISLAFGLYRLSAGEKELSKMLEFTELARLEAKKQQKNKIVFYRKEFSEAVIRVSNIESRMEQALFDGEFVAYFQPKYDLATGRAVGAEALARWITAEGIVEPGGFIDIFERNGFILKMDLYIFEHVCEKIRKWLDEGRGVLPVAVNVSRMHLLEPDFIENYRNIIAKYQVPPELLELELTENLPFTEEDFLLEILNNLKKIGIKLTMDDFGSGYSTLNILQNMPFDVLKIDRLFFRDRTDTGKGRNIIESVILMAQKLGLEVVAEGVETEGEVEFLQAIGCNIVQGYFFAKPMPLEEYENLLGAESF